MKDAIQQEAKEARQKYGPFNSTHEIYAVLQEEVNEFWDLVQRKQTKSNPHPDALAENVPEMYVAEMIDELIQVAAIAQRAIKELEKGEVKWV